MIKPKPLQEGSVVAIVATARAVFSKDLEFAKDWLTSCGYQVILADNIDHTYHQFAGNDEMRISALQKIIDDDSIDAIWFGKGGYGSARIVDAINFEPLMERPKWFIGYSDPTVFHLALYNKGIMSLHGAMPVGLADKSMDSRVHLNDLLRGKELHYRLEKASALNRDGEAEGRLIGGNLSVIQSVIGSPTSLYPQDNILFLEDLDEYLYHIDRMMINLRRNGIFERINGLIIGSFNAMNDNDVAFGKTAYEIIKDLVEQYDLPIYFGFPAGHEVDNYPLLLGEEVVMKVNDGRLNLRAKNGST